MKYFIYLILLLITTNSYACELKNNEFVLMQHIDTNYFNFTIYRKDNMPFEYSKEYSNIIFINYKYTTINYEYKDYLNPESSLTKYPIKPPNKDFVDLKKKLTNIYSNNEQDNLFKNSSGEYTHSRYFEQIKSNIPYKYKYGKQLIKYKNTIYLDKQLTKCVTFESKPILYDFGYKYLFNSWK